MNRVELSRVENNKRQPAADKTSINLLLKAVCKTGFNIHSLINKFKKKHGYDLPDPVITKVCGYYVHNSGKIKNQWGWFLVSVKRASEAYFAQKNREEGEKWKKAPIAKELKDIIMATKLTQEE